MATVEMKITAETTLAEYIEQRYNFFKAVGAATLLDAFLIRNAAFQRGEPLPNNVAQMELGHCFANAARLTLERDWFYVEGYASSEDVGVPLLHAWNVTKGGKLVDATWRKPEKTEYFGVAFNRADMGRWLSKQKHYGLLDTGVGLNIELMLGMDPDLADEFPQLKQWRKK